MLQAMLGVLLMAGSFLTGLIFGVVGSRKRLDEWMKENGCYLCQERWKNPLGL